MQICAFGYRNLVLLGSLTADQAVAGLPVSNLQLPQGAASLGWRSPVLTATLTLTLSQVETLRAVSVHRTNLSAQARWTVMVSRAGVEQVRTSQPCQTLNGQALLILRADVTGDTVQVTLEDPGNPDGYLSIPLCFIGTLWQPVRNYSTSSTDSWDYGIDETTSLSGEEFPQARWSRRKLSIVHQSLGDVDLPAVRVMASVSGQGGNILFLPDPDRVPLAETALFGRVALSEISNPFGPADRHAVTFTLTERL